jgi:oligopeptidase A
MYDGWNFIKNSAGFKDLTSAQKRIVDESLLGMKHSGIALEGAKKERFNEIKKQLVRNFIDR